LPAAKPAGWKITDAGLPLKGKASSPAKMPTFSARLSTSHFPGPDTGIVLGLFLFTLQHYELVYLSMSYCPSCYAVFYPATTSATILPPLLADIIANGLQ